MQTARGQVVLQLACSVDQSHLLDICFLNSSLNFRQNLASGVVSVLVRMELARIVMSELNDQQIVYLREVDGPRSFPILIGIFEATSIDRRVQGHIPPRPLTHDLLKNAIEDLGGEIQDVIITNLVERTYYAVIRIRQNNELVEVDSRPSDAIALAAHFSPHLPIYVDDDVIEAAL